MSQVNWLFHIDHTPERIPGGAGRGRSRLTVGLDLMILV